MDRNVKPVTSIAVAKYEPGKPEKVERFICFWGRVGLVGLMAVTLLCSCKQSRAPLTNLETQVDSIYRSLADEPQLQHGYEVYRDYGCVLCHGANGMGGVKNINAQTGEEIPAMTYIAEGYTIKEFKARVLKGVSKVARLDSLGRVPPYSMPGFGRMKNSQLIDLSLYVWNLYPKDEEDDW